MGNHGLDGLDARTAPPLVSRHAVGAGSLCILHLQSSVSSREPASVARPRQPSVVRRVPGRGRGNAEGRGAGAARPHHGCVRLYRYRCARGAYLFFQYTIIRDNHGIH